MFDEGAGLIFFLLRFSPFATSIPDQLVDLGFDAAVASGDEQA